MPRRLSIAILGSYTASELENDLARELGQQLASVDANIVSGGQQGVMHSLSQAVYQSRDPANPCRPTLVGILPKFGFEEANPYIDIAIPTGAGHLQNSILPLCGDIVVAIGGAAGTLTEIAIAWQYKKPICLLGNTGWSKKLAGTALDHRRDETLVHFTDATFAFKWIKRILSQAPNFKP